MSSIRSSLSVLSGALPSTRPEAQGLGVLPIGAKKRQRPHGWGNFAKHVKTLAPLGMMLFHDVSQWLAFTMFWKLRCMVDAEAQMQSNVKQWS